MGGDGVIRKVDAVLVRVGDLKAGLAFYRGLGHRILWRTETQIGLAMPDTDAELVLSTEAGPETDLLVADLDAALDRFTAGGGMVVTPAFDIQVGRVAVAEDPFGNRLTLVELTGRYETDAGGNVTGTRRAG